MGHEPNKYHVSRDGRVYEVNEDGSFTELGDVSSLKHPQTQATRQTPAPASRTTPSPTPGIEKKENGGWGKALFWIVVLINVAVCAALFIWEAIG